jgi:hypothetical protein
MTSDADRDLAIQWWDSNTEVSPNKKDVVRLRSNDKSPALDNSVS